jgi:glycosyltransferase involved in cell wall biosynthesis
MRWLNAHGLPELGNLTSFLWRCRAEYAAADVLHLHNLHGEYLSILALPLWGLDKPIVWTLHDAWPLTGNCAYPRECTRWLRACGRCPQLGLYPMPAVDRSRFYRWLKPRVAAAAHPVLLPSSYWLAEQVRRVPQMSRLPLEVIPNPVATEVFAPVNDRAAARRAFGLRPDAPTVVLVGCLYGDPRKNASDAIASLRRAVRRVPDLQVLTVGSSSARLLAETGLPGQALPFFQERAPLAQAYGCADLCLFPSQADNHPMTVLESMACGTPVVAYAIGGIPDQIEHLNTGFLAPAGQIDALSAGVIQLAQNPHATHAMGRRAREFILRTSSVPVVVAQFETAYRRAVRAWQRRRQRARACFARGPVIQRIAAALGWEEPQCPRPRPLPMPQPVPEGAR